MKIPEAYAGRFFYHFTHVDNIESIVKDGLLSTNMKNKRGISHTNLANECIQHRRSQMAVPCCPNGVVHDYVPFYFASKNPMLLGLLHKKTIDQPLIVFIAISIDKLLMENVLFTDASANTDIPPKFFKDPKDLDHLKWNLIDSGKWAIGDELHSRMAEVLIHEKVPIDWIDSYIVFNEISKQKIIQIYQDNGLLIPKVSFEPFKHRYFYFTKFFMKERECETLITGPVDLKILFEGAVQNINKSRKENGVQQPKFNDINDALSKIENNFCVIEELEGIYKLKTDNSVHTECVSDHTLKVVSKLEENTYYQNLSESDKRIVKLSGYLHDIGKGPKSKWQNGIQAAYPDHPADAIPMIKRILSKEFNSISEYEIRKICLLVFYHDIIGEILGNGRSEKELLDLKINKNELNMLIALSWADVSSLCRDWEDNLKLKIPAFIDKITKDFEK